jgi:hypothetical protein
MSTKANGKSLGVAACTAIVVGNMVGSGFYLSPAIVAPCGNLAVTNIKGNFDLTASDFDNVRGRLYRPRLAVMTGKCMGGQHLISPCAARK